MPTLAAPKAKRGKAQASSNEACATRSRKSPRMTKGAQQQAIGVLQPKLRVNEPNDQFEREADRVAERVISMREPDNKSGGESHCNACEHGDKKPIQREEMKAPEEEEAQTFSLQRETEAAEEEEAQTSSLQREAEAPEEEEAQTFSLQRETEKAEEEEAQASSLQREAESPEEEEAQTFSLQRRAAEEQKKDEEMQQRARGPGRPQISPRFESHFRLMRRGGGDPLPDHLRAFLEPRFGRSFADVRVHTGPAAAGLAREANARAFTVDRHIVFGDGEYRPNVQQGQRLIAHELTHVLQQQGGLHSVQREIAMDESDRAAQKRNVGQALEELRNLFALQPVVVSPMVLRIAEEVLRTALTGDSWQPLIDLLDKTDAKRVKRTIEAGGYSLEFEVDHGEGVTSASWSITRKSPKQLLFMHTEEMPGKEGGASGAVDEQRRTVATPLPPKYEAAGAAPPDTDVGPPSSAEPEIAVEASPPPQAVTPPVPIKSAALDAADAPSEVDQKPVEAEGGGETAGKDQPSNPRKPVDEDPEAKEVPEEPPAEDVEVHRKAAGTGGPPRQPANLAGEVVSVTHSSGKPIPDAARNFLEPRFGADLRGVRLHDDARSSRLARSLGAKAFATGEHIVFGSGHFQPETTEGRRLLAHEISHVLQQRYESRGRDVDVVQRQGDDCPPPDPVPTVEVVSSPQGPQEDPAFQSTENRVDNRAENQKAHGPGEAKSESANAAAEVKEGEKASHAQTDQVGKMEAAAQNPPAFDKQAFVEKVLAEVEAIAPHTLDDVMKFKSEGKAAQVKTAVTSDVQSTQEKSQGPLSEAASADPGAGESPRTATPLEVEPPGAEPGSVRADRAMPPPKTESEMDMSPETVETENILKEACVTREFMEKHDDPELKEGIAAQDGLQEAAETKPQEFREQEEAELASARSGASGEGASGVQSMFGSRSDDFENVGAGQNKAKSDNEIKRDQAAAKVDMAFKSTQDKVDKRLTKLETDVMTQFDTEATTATDKFERFVRENAEKYEESWLDTALDMLADILFDPPPKEVRDFYAEGRRTFLTEMKVTVEGLADLVDEGLKDARKIVEDGKTEVKTIIDGLGSDLGDFKQQLSDEMNDKFRGLEAKITEKQGNLIKGLAERYVKAFERVKAIENQVREEYKNFLQKAQDAYHAVKDMIVGQIEKLAAIVGAAADRIIRDPGTFLSNLGQGIIQGLTMFMSEIGENIKTAVVQWLTGNLGGAGIPIPTSFDAKGIIGFLLDIVGLGITSIKNIARKVLGNAVVTLIEKGEAGAEKVKEIFDILSSEGPAGLFRYLQAEFDEMKEQIMGEAGAAIAEGLVIAGIKKVLGIISGLVSGGVGTVITIVLTIIDVILWFRDNAAQLAELVSTIAGTAMAILQGQVGVVAGAINNLLKRVLPLVLGFVGALVGIGGVVRKIQQIFKAIKKPATKAITALFQKLKKGIKKLLGKAKKGKKKKKGKELTSAQVVSRVLKEMKRKTKAETPEAALAEKKAHAQSLLSKYQPQLKKGKLKITIIDNSAADVEKNSAVDFDVAASPGRKGKAPVPIKVDDEGAVRKRFARARSLKKFTAETGFGVPDWAGTFTKLAAGTHQKDLSFGVTQAIVTRDAGKYHFKSKVSKKEIVTRGAAAVQDQGRGHAPFQKGRFGVPLIQTFLTSRKIAGVPPDSYGDAGTVSAVATRAEKAGAIKKVGKTPTWALPTIPAKRNLPAGWGGASHVRPRYYDRGSGFDTAANTFAITEINNKVRPEIAKLVQNPNNLAPWNQLKADKLAWRDETFSKNAAKMGVYFERARYHVDHVKPLASHWNVRGNNADQGERIAANLGKRGGWQLLEARQNESKGSDGVTYELWVGANFTATSGDQFHADTGEPFVEFK